MILSINNKLVSINGGLTNYNVPPPPPVPDYEYFSFKVSSNATIHFDPIGGTYKHFDNSISTDLTTGETFPSNGGSGDWPNFNVTQDHVYSFVWSEEDLQSTFGSGLYGNNAGWEDSSSKGYISEIYSLDFWHASDWTKADSGNSFSNCSIIPQSSDLIFRGESLTSCARMFADAPIQNSIEAFILAMQTACPNLSNTSGCFSGCTSAPDYNYCLTTYPDWF